MFCVLSACYCFNMKKHQDVILSSLKQICMYVYIRQMPGLFPEPQRRRATHHYHHHHHHHHQLNVDLNIPLIPLLIFPLECKVATTFDWEWEPSTRQRWGCAYILSIYIYIYIYIFIYIFYYLSYIMYYILYIILYIVYYIMFIVYILL